MSAEPVRICASCGVRRPKRELQRFVWGGECPVADLSGCRSGRGAYSCIDETCLRKFVTQKKKWKRLFRL